MFRAASKAEVAHGGNHFRTLKAVRSTQENLPEAVSGENHEYDRIYLEMINTAKSEKLRSAEMSCNYANEVEKIHPPALKIASVNLNKSAERGFRITSVLSGETRRKGGSRCLLNLRHKMERFKRID